MTWQFALILRQMSSSAARQTLGATLEDALKYDTVQGQLEYHSCINYEGTLPTAARNPIIGLFWDRIQVKGTSYWLGHRNYSLFSVAFIF